MRGRIPSFEEFVMMKAQQAAANQVATQQSPTALAAPAPSTRYGNDEASLMNLQYGNRGLPPVAGPMPPTAYDSPSTMMGGAPPLEPDFQEILRRRAQQISMLSGPPAGAPPPTPSQVSGIDFGAPSGIVANDMLATRGSDVYGQPNMPSGYTANDMIPLDLALRQYAERERQSYLPQTTPSPGLGLGGYVANPATIEQAREAVDAAFAAMSANPSDDAARSAYDKAIADYRIARTGSSEDTGSLLAKAGEIADAPLYWVRGHRAENAYRVSKFVETDSFQDPWAIEQYTKATGKAPATQQEWDDFRVARLNEFALGNGLDPYAMQNPVSLSNLKDYDFKIDEYGGSYTDKQQYRKEIIAAYENGFSPQKRELTDAGVWVDRPTGAFYEPGERAAWEYIAGRQGTATRVLETIVDDPTNLPLGGVTGIGKEAVVRGGVSLAEEASQRAAREAGNVLLNEGERVVGRAADDAWWVATAPTLEPGETILMQDDAGNYVVQRTIMGATETRVVPPKIVQRSSATDRTAAEVIGSWAQRTSGALQVGGGYALQIPDAIINPPIDRPISAALSGTRDALKEVPVLGHLFQSEKRTLAASEAHLTNDALGEAKAGATRANVDTGSYGPSAPPPRQDPFGGPPSEGTAPPTGPMYGPRMPYAEPPKPGSFADTAEPSPASPSPAPASPTPLVREKGGYTYLGDGNQVRIAPTPDGMFVVERWGGSEWVDADLPAQTNLDDAVAMASDSLPITSTVEQPTLTTSQVDTVENPNLPQPKTPKQKVQPELTGDPGNVVGDEWQPTVTEPGVTQPKLTESPSYEYREFDPDVAYPADLPKWDGPDQPGIAFDAAIRGFEQPEAGYKFFDQYRDLVRDYNERLKAYQDANKGKNWVDFKNAQDWYKANDFHYLTPGEMALQIEHLGKSLKAYREAFGEAPDYLMRYGDELAITGPGPLPTGWNGQDLAETAFIRRGEGMEPIYVVSYAGDEWTATNIDNVIEQAAFNPDDAVAAEARRFLRAFRKEAPELIDAERAASRARLVSEMGKTGKESTNAFNKERIAKHEWVWRTVEGTGERVQVPTSGKGSRPKLKFTNAIETPDGEIIYMQSGFGGAAPTPGQATPEMPRDERPVVPHPNLPISDAAQRQLSKVLNGGRHDKMTVKQVLEHYIPRAERDREEYLMLKRMGGDADLVDRKTKGKLIGNVKKAEEKGVETKRLLSAGQGSFAPTKSAAEMQKIHERVAELEILWNRYGDIAKMDAYDLAAKRTAWEHAVSIAPKLAHDRKLVWDLLHALFYRLPRTLLLADPITSWTYVQRNMISNIQMTAFADWNAVTSKANWGNFTKNAFDPENSAAARIYDTVFGSHMPDQFRQTAGMLEDITETGIDMAPVGTGDKITIGRGPKGRVTPTRRFLDKMGIGFTAKAGEPYDWMRNVTRNLERSSKLGAFVPIFQVNHNEAIVRTAQQISAAAERMGLSGFDEQTVTDLMFGLRNSDGVFSRDELYSALLYKARDEGYVGDVAHNFADRGTRDWINAAKQAGGDAIAKINHIFPNALNQTNLDHYLSYVTLFHFWPTRAMAFLAEEMLRNPRLIVNWVRLHNGFERMAEEGEYPDAVRGLVRLWQSPWGYALYSNPSALFLVTALVPAGPDLQERNNVAGIGRALQALRQKTGLSFVPMLDATLSLIGVYGDSTVPDIIPSRTADLVLAGLDVVLTQMGHNPHTPVWDQTMQRAREFLSRITPGISTIEAGNASGYAYDIIGSVVLDMNPELRTRMMATETLPDGSTRPTADAAAALSEYDAIMADPSSPEYQDAEKRAALVNLGTKVMNLWFPFSVRSNLTSRSETVQLASEGRAVRDEGGTPTPGQQGAITVRAQETATPAALTLQSQQAQDKAFGTPAQKQLQDTWTSIAFPDPNKVIFANGTVYSPVELAQMPQEDRMALADQIVAQMDPNGDLEAYRTGRDALRAGMPEYQAYLDWQSWMRDQPGEIAGARVELMRTSPGYKTYIDGLDPALKADPEAFDRASISTDAYLAQRGESWSVYEGDPGAASDPSSLTVQQLTSGGSDTGSGGGSSSSKSDTAAGRLESLTKAQKKYDAAMAKFNAKVADITGGATYEDLSPMWQESLKRRLAREGIDVPSKPLIVADYEAWLKDNPNGTPMEYVQWLVDNGI